MNDGREDLNCGVGVKKHNEMMWPCEENVGGRTGNELYQGRATWHIGQR